jgi:hypothetical protein
MIDFHPKNPWEGCRQLTFMMLDADVVAVNPASVWRVLKEAERLTGGEPSRRPRRPAPSDRSSSINIGISMPPDRRLWNLTKATGTVPACVFQKPSLPEENDYCHHRGNQIDP